MESQTVTRLKEKYREAISNNAKLQGDIAYATGKSVATVQRWVRENTEQLIMISVLNEIKKSMGIPDRVLLTEEVSIEEANKAA